MCVCSIIIPLSIESSIRGNLRRTARVRSLCRRARCHMRTRTRSRVTVRTHTRRVILRSRRVVPTGKAFCLVEQGTLLVVVLIGLEPDLIQARGRRAARRRRKRCREGTGSGHYGTVWGYFLVVALGAVKYLVGGSCRCSRCCWMVWMFASSPPRQCRPNQTSGENQYWKDERISFLFGSLLSLTQHH